MLSRWLPPTWAAILTVLWYAGLILAVVLCWRGEDLFRYGRI